MVYYGVDMLRIDSARHSFYELYEFWVDRLMKSKDLVEDKINIGVKV